MAGVAVATTLGVSLLGGSDAFAADPVLAAAGDIACSAAENASPPRPSDCGQKSTSDLILRMNPTAVATLGDNQYEDATAADFAGHGAYNDTWGLFREKTHPVAGNHEYGFFPSSGNQHAAGYYGYFGAAAGGIGSASVEDRGYYSYEVGSWHVVALDSNCNDNGCFARGFDGGAVSTAEVNWLTSDLAAHRGQCTLAYWHHPRFTDGGEGESTGTQPLWNALYDAGADVVLNGHDHLYERYKQLDNAGNPVAVDASGTPRAGSKGIREFVVGTGGRNHEPHPNPWPPAVSYLNSTDYGVLFLTLGASSYTSQWIKPNGEVLDSRGAAQCHQPQPVIGSPASPPAGQTAHFSANGATPDANTVRWKWDFGDGGRAATQNPDHTYAGPGSYTVTLTETDGRGLTATRSAVVSVTAVPLAPSLTSPALTGEGPGGPATQTSTGPGAQTSQAQPSPTPETAPLPPATTRLLGASVSGDTVTLVLDCQGAAGQACSATAALTSHKRLRGSRPHAVFARGKTARRTTALLTDATGSYNASAGRSTKIRLTLNPAARKLVKRFKRLPATITIDGKPAGAVTFRAKKTRKR